MNSMVPFSFCSCQDPQASWSTYESTRLLALADGVCIWTDLSCGSTVRHNARCGSWLDASCEILPFRTSGALSILFSIHRHAHSYSGELWQFLVFGIETADASGPARRSRRRVQMVQHLCALCARTYGDKQWVQRAFQVCVSTNIRNATDTWTSVIADGKVRLSGVVSSPSFRNFPGQSSFSGLYLTRFYGFLAASRPNLQTNTVLKILTRLFFHCLQNSIAGCKI